MDLRKKLGYYLPPDPAQSTGSADLTIIAAGAVMVLLAATFLTSLLIRDAHTNPAVKVEPSAWRESYSFDRGVTCAHDMAALLGSIMEV